MDYHYIQLANELERKIRSGSYRAGEKLPSLRSMHQQTGRSISTVVQAYTELEQRGVIDVRERSGVYVKPLLDKILPRPQSERTLVPPVRVTINEMASILDETARNPAMLPFGSALPDPEILPGKHLAREIRAAAVRYSSGELIGYCQPNGLDSLRTELAKRMVGWQAAPDDGEVIVTGGCMAAISLCLRAVAGAGDIILVQSPTFLCYLQLIEDLEMQALEIPVDPEKGIDMELLAAALDKQEVKAALINANFHNPLGCLMPDDDKQRLIRLFQHKNIPVIEDDIYGDLYFGEKRPRPLKHFDESGLVLYCSSFSKSLAPDLRIGWTVPGKYLERVKRLNFNSSLSHSQLLQHVIASFLHSGAYERHLRRMRNSLKKQMAQLISAVAQSFPPGTRVSSPQGGLCLWVELPAGVDTWHLFEMARAHNISIVPGTLCSATNRFNTCLRLNFGYRWSRKQAKGIALLGQMIAGMSEDASS